MIKLENRFQITCDKFAFYFHEYNQNRKDNIFLEDFWRELINKPDAPFILWDDIKDFSNISITTFLGDKIEIKNETLVLKVNGK